MTSHENLKNFKNITKKDEFELVEWYDNTNERIVMRIPPVIHSKKFSYYPVKYISSGSYGHVLLYRSDSRDSRDKYTGKPMYIAVKVIHKSRGDCIDSSSLTICNNNILQQRCITPHYVRNWEEYTPTILIMEPMDGDVHDYLYEFLPTKKERTKICRDITKGLTCVNTNKGYYVDLKTENCLYRQNEKKGTEFFLGDLGLCKKGYSFGTTYPSPEYFINEEECHEPETVWQLGLFILRVLATTYYNRRGGTKWDRSELKKKTASLTTKQKELLLEKETSKLKLVFDKDKGTANLKGKEILKKCVSYDPKDRPTLKQVLRVLNNNLRKPRKLKSVK